MKFTYGSGTRVLDGYTLKRGIGRGGFGEVYYALSDGGKEVALKLIRGANLDVELRGMAQCLNLKHPNLLQLYDIRGDAAGEHWVVMEYISGEALSSVISRHAEGLPLDLTHQWFREISRGVGCLHTHGIVHRDLKPANVFLEAGTVKIGDYGLSKFMSSTQHTAQTQSIGTVHYMAPEISTGNYNKQIDVYASGIILYEMLTGHVPFDGESAGEILMKHMTSAPDLAKIPPPYVPVVSKSLAKNPAQRYQNMSEMAEAVDRVGSVGGRPQADSIPVAEAVSPATAAPRARRPLQSTGAWQQKQAVTPREQVAELCGSMASATVFALLASLVWAAVSSPENLAEIGTGFFLTVCSCWSVLVPAKMWPGRAEDSGSRRALQMLLGLGVGLAALWLDYGSEVLPGRGFAWTVSSHNAVAPWGEGLKLPVAAGTLGYFGLVFFAMRWWKLADRYRPSRFSFGPVLGAAFWAAVLIALAPVSDMAAPVVLTAIIVQLVSPWEEPLPALPKRMRLRMP
jgi:eukaryotic-like serine/threonine-protein kinase